MNSFLAFDFLILLRSDVDEGVLDQLNVTRGGVLILQGPEDKLRSVIEFTRSRGYGHLWSDESMYRHLALLSNTYSNAVHSFPLVALGVRLTSRFRMTLLPRRL